MFVAAFGLGDMLGAAWLNTPSLDSTLGTPCFMIGLLVMSFGYLGAVALAPRAGSKVLSTKRRVIPKVKATIHETGATLPKLDAAKGSRSNEIVEAKTRGGESAVHVKTLHRPDASKHRTDLCMICKGHLRVADSVLSCPYCKGTAHRNEFLEWIHVKDACPACGRHLNEDMLLPSRSTENAAEHVTREPKSRAEPRSRKGGRFQTGDGGKSLGSVR